MNFDLNDKMITDLDNRIAWTFGYLKEEKNLFNLTLHIHEKDDIMMTTDSFYKSRDYMVNNHPELLV